MKNRTPEQTARQNMRWLRRWKRRAWWRRVRGRMGLA